MKYLISDTLTSLSSLSEFSITEKRRGKKKSQWTKLKHFDCTAYSVFFKLKKVTGWVWKCFLYRRYFHYLLKQKSFYLTKVRELYLKSQHCYLNHPALSLKWDWAQKSITHIGHCWGDDSIPGSHHHYLHWSTCPSLSVLWAACSQPWQQVQVSKTEMERAIAQPWYPRTMKYHATTLFSQSITQKGTRNRVI